MMGRTDLRVKTLTLGSTDKEEIFVRLIDYEELETENLKLKKRLKKYEKEERKPDERRQ